MLRIDPTDPDGPGLKSYSVPSDNPYVGQSGKKPEIWAYGLRNPWRWSFDRGNGDLWIGDVGQRKLRGDRPRRRERRCWTPARATTSAGTSAKASTVPRRRILRCLGGERRPSSRLSHGDGFCAIIGGFVYRGSDTPAWDGVYTFSDNCTGEIYAIQPDDPTNIFVSHGTRLGVSGFGEDAAGRLYVADVSGGTISTLTFTGSPPN